MHLEIPDPHDASTVTMPDGAEIRVRRHGNLDAPLRLLMSHGNGFAIDGYFPFWSLLLDDYDVVTFDLRNHGRNPLHREDAHGIAQFVDDFERIADHVEGAFGERPTAGVFHSVSGITALAHALERGWRWHSLVVVDPPLIPSPGHPLYESMRNAHRRLAARAQRRRAVFSDPLELARRFQRSDSRRGWRAGTHELMARSVLRHDPEEGVWRLACPPSFEARIYRANGELDLSPSLPDIEGRVGFLCADPGVDEASSPATVNASVAAQHGHGYTYIPNTTHMLQVEEPEASAEAVVRFLEDGEWA